MSVISEGGNERRGGSESRYGIVTGGSLGVCGSVWSRAPPEPVNVRLRVVGFTLCPLRTACSRVQEVEQHPGGGSTRYVVGLPSTSSVRPPPSGRGRTVSQLVPLPTGSTLVAAGRHALCPRFRKQTKSPQAPVKRVLIFDHSGQSRSVAAANAQVSRGG